MRPNRSTAPGSRSHRAPRREGLAARLAAGLAGHHQWTNERTVIATAFPRVGVGNKIPLILPATHHSPHQIARLIANLSAIALDYSARQKVGGTTLNFFILFQLPILPPSFYTAADLAIIVPRVLELT